MITIHHLLVSQSERVIWLIEELGLPYELKSYPRNPQTRQADPVFSTFTPFGQAPVIQDGDLTLAESGAILTYIIETYGQGRFRVAPGESGYADYIYWFHYGAGSFAPMAIQNLASVYLADDQRVAMTRRRFAQHLGWVDARLADSAYLAGRELTAADMMIQFWFGTASAFAKIDVEPYPNIRAWLARIAERPAFQRAMKAAGNN